VPRHTQRAFITVHPDGPRWSLIRGGPAEPLQAAARLAGVELRWSRTDRAWLVPNDRVPDLIAAGQLARLVTVRAAS
jgi:hypothetical protein